MTRLLALALAMALHWQLAGYWESALQLPLSIQSMSELMAASGQSRPARKSGNGRQPLLVAGLALIVVVYYFWSRRGATASSLIHSIQQLLSTQPLLIAHLRTQAAKCSRSASATPRPMLSSGWRSLATCMASTMTYRQTATRRRRSLTRQAAPSTSHALHVDHQAVTFLASWLPKDRSGHRSSPICSAAALATQQPASCASTGCRTALRVIHD